MHNKPKFVIISAIIFAQLILFAGNTQAAIPATLLEDSGAWFHAVAEGSLKRVNPALAKVRVWVEGQSGFDQAMDHWYTGLVRVAVGLFDYQSSDCLDGLHLYADTKLGVPFKVKRD